MKKLLAVSLFCLLPGCAIIDSFLMKYDPNEYAMITDIRTFANASVDSCGTDNAAKNADVLSLKTTQFANYTEYLPHNEPTKKSAVELNAMAQGLSKQYQTSKVSPAFCKIKFAGVAASAEVIQKIVGAKPR